MSLYLKLIAYGTSNNGNRPVHIKGDEKSKQLSKAYGGLAEAKRAILANDTSKPEKLARYLGALPKERDEKMTEVFGSDWYKLTKQSWKKEEDQLVWLKQFIEKRKLSAEDWYKITIDDFKDGGLGLIDKYDNSIKKLLDKFGSILYPNYEWHEWNFGRVITWGIPYRNEYKIDEENTTKYDQFKQKVLSNYPLLKSEIPLFRRFMDHIMMIEKIEDVHLLTASHLLKYTGAGLVTVGLSFKQLLTYAYPEHEIHDFLLHPIPREFWEDDVNLRSVFEYYCKKNNISFEQLNNVPKQALVQFGGWYGLKKIKENGSWFSLLQRAFPEIDWDPFQVSRMSWTLENKQEVLRRLAEYEEWTQNEDYYKLTIQLAKSYKLEHLLMHYNNSPIRLLRELKPEYEWKEWKFSKSNNCWGDGTVPNMERIRNFFDDFKNENNLKSLDEFTQYIVKQFPQGILVYFRFNLYTCMSQVYPEYTWNEADFQAVNYSKVATSCWNDIMKNDPRLNIQHKLTGGEVKIGKNPVDGHYEASSYDDALQVLNNLPSYCTFRTHKTATNIAFQFHGTYWHGHPSFYNADDIQPNTGKTYGYLYNKTLDITNKIAETHHVVEIWEHDFNKYS